MNGGSHIAHEAVVIPFDVGAAGFLDQSREGFLQIGDAFRVRHIKHVLVAFQQGLHSIGLQDELRMVPRQIRVWIRHLRLDPYPRIQAKSAKIALDEGEIPAEFFLVEIEIAKGALIVLTMRVSAIVENEGVAAGIRSEARKLLPGLFVYLRPYGLPGIEDDGVLFLVENMLIYERIEALLDPV